MVLIYDNFIKVLCSVEDLLFIDIMGWFDFKMYILDKKIQLEYLLFGIGKII